MSEHTPERWTMVHNDGVFPNVYGPEGRFIGQVSTDEDARRIVACVNATKGISTEALEEYGQKPWAPADELAMAQYATVQARLAEAERLLAGVLASENDTHRQSDDRWSVFRQDAHAFLTEAKP